jgi:hypothetical protein
MSLADWFTWGGQLRGLQIWRRFQRRGPGEDERVTRWKQAWTAAVAAPDPQQVLRLRADLDALDLSADDLEIEREMLDALQQLASLAATVGSDGLPVVQTGHRVVGSERCHFSAPASMPDEPGQPGGRLLLTSGRAIFVGGSSARTMAWHMVAEAIQAERDLLLVRVDRAHLYRFRLNSFADALSATFLAKRLLGRRR